MAVLPQATPLLLTKRLNAFLNANTTPQLPTLLLTTYHGKLLAHASAASQPVYVLRTHATVAASLLAIHTSSSVALPSALPGSETPDLISSAPPSVHDRDDDDDDDEETARGTDDEIDPRHQQQQQQHTAAGAQPGHSVKPVTITVQLSGGTVIIRRLKCGLLFVCVGPSSHDAPSAPSSTAAGPTAAAAAASASAASAAMTGSSLGAAGSGGGSSNNHSNSGGMAAVTQALESADLLNATTAVADTESLVSAGGQTTASIDSSASTSVVAMRRHAAELARWLDDKLGTLSVPEDSTGGE
ncbi:hypothetical protein PWT90_07620 [Aphanocladium album]|nr:hypothetical protein PWT90_07620 [Aphanocladium album]